MKNLKLKSGHEIPILGLGTWELKGNKCVEAIKTALRIGYRHIDTADYYQNHEEVGRGIAESGVKREEIFITTKVWPRDLSKSGVINACERFLEELNVDYIDLLLIHWPNRSYPIEETAEGFNQLLEEGKIKSFGVSNFDIGEIKEAVGAGMQVVNDQVEIHPSSQEKELKEFCDKEKITVTAYSPLGRSSDLRIREIKDLAEKYRKSPSQIILRWLVQSGLIAIPKASSKEHLKENFEIFDWKLEEKDLQIINSI